MSDFETLVQPAEFKRIAQFCSSVLAGKNIIPIINHALFRADGESLTVSATNLDQTATLSLPCSSRGAFTAPVQRLSAIAGVLGAGPVTIAAKWDAERGDVTISQECGRHEMASLAPDDFPQHSSAGWKIEVEAPADDMARSLARLSHFRARDDTRWYMTGVFFDRRNGLLCATDGRFLARDPAPWWAGDGDGMIVPSAAIRPVVAMLAKSGLATLRVREGWAEFAYDGASVGTKLVAGEFPNIDRVLPTSHSARWRVSVEELSLALARCMTVSGEDYGGSMIKCEFGASRLSLSRKLSDGSAAASSSCACEQIDGDPLTIGLGAERLQTILRSLDCDEVEIAATDAAAPVVILPYGETMPYRLLMPFALNP